MVEERCGPARAFLFNGYDEVYGIPAGLQAFYDEMERQGMVVRLQPMQSGVPGVIGRDAQANRQRGWTWTWPRTWSGRPAWRMSRRWSSPPATRT